MAWNQWERPNHNAVLLAESGAGKSFLGKLDLLQNLYQGVEAAVVDPDGEYLPLAGAVGGTVIRLGAPGVHLNPLDLPHHTGMGTTGDAGSDALTRQALFLHTLVAVLLGGPLDASTAAALDRAVLATYHQAGITADPRTHARPAPLLADLAAQLATDRTDPAAQSLASALTPYTSGSFHGLFAGPSTADPQTGHLVVFSLKDLPDELMAAGMLMATNAIWRRISTGPTRRRLVVVDEAWRLLSSPACAAWLARLAKGLRKYWAGLTLITQDVADVLSTDLGRAVVANASTQILLRQEPQTIDDLADAFALTAGERAMLLTAEVGHGLLVSGTSRVSFCVEASDAEKKLLNTSPALATDDEAGPELAGGPDTLAV